MDKVNQSLLSDVPDEMVPDINVFDSIMVLWVIGKVNSTLVVYID